MSLQRYEIIDEYSLKELLLEYENSDAHGRIQLLRSLHQKNVGLPFELASLAVRDSSVQVRRWFASNARVLDYSDHNGKDPSRDLTDTIKRDKDLFVRASLFENPNIYDSLGFFFHSKEFFNEASHLERLALVRNPAVSHDLIEKIFNLDDTELSLSLEQRKQLALAYLTNPNAQEESRRDFFSFHNGWDAYSTTNHYRMLYDYVSKWPKNSFPLDYLVKAIHTDDSTKARFYHTCDTSFWRASILANCKSTDGETLQLGMKDSNADCRRIAFSKVTYLTPEQIDTLLNSEDQDAIWGLAGNENLSIETLCKVRDRLQALDHDLGTRDADATIQRLEMKNIKNNPQKLFSVTDEQNTLLRNKVDFIGGKILALERLFVGDEQDPLTDKQDTVRGKLEFLETQVLLIHQRLKEIWIVIIIAAILLVIFRLLK